MTILRRSLKILALALVVLLVIGGAFIGNLLTSNAYPHPEGQGWIRLRDMPRPRGEAGSTVVLPGPPGTPDICPRGACAPQLMVAGGLRGPFAQTVAFVDILDAGTGRWRSGPNLPEPRHHAALAAIDGSAYLSGGARHATRWTPEKNLWVLRPNSDSWDRLPDMPEGRMGHQMIAANGKLYVIGGRGESSKVLIYDRTSGWSEGAPMPTPRDHLAAVLVQNKIYAIGGRHHGIVRNVDIYDIATDTWSQGPSLPRPMSAMAAGLLADGRIHVVGGEDPGTFGGGVIDRHFMLDLASGTWSSAPKALLAVHGAGYGEIAGVLLIAGGSRRQGTFSVLAWTGVTQEFNPRQAPGAPSRPPGSTPAPRATTPAPVTSLPGD